jgi:hypothetical protein
LARSRQELVERALARAEEKIAFAESNLQAGVWIFASTSGLFS